MIFWHTLVLPEAEPPATPIMNGVGSAPSSRGLAGIPLVLLLPLLYRLGKKSAFATDAMFMTC